MNKPYAYVLAVASFACVAAVSTGCEEAVDEATNNIRCDDICEYAVDCGVVGGTIDACQNACEAAGDESQAVEDNIELCADCLNHDEVTCEQNNELCAAECEGVPLS